METKKDELEFGDLRIPGAKVKRVVKTRKELEEEYKRTHPESARDGLENCCGQPPGLGFGGE